MGRKLFTVSAVVFIAAGVAFWSRDEPVEAPAKSQLVESPRPPVVAPIARAEPSSTQPLPLPLPVAVVQDAAVPEVVDAGPAAVDAGAVSEPTTPLAEAPAPTPPTFTIDAGHTRTPNDPRFTIRWGQPGLCGEEPLERLAQRRAALLSSFVGVRRAGTVIFHDPDAPLAFVDLAGDSLSQARVIVSRLLGPRADVALPVIYVYASGEQMRDVACVNTATAGYYDGAIHLPATDPDGYRTIVHEHVHHVLNALGLRKPMWFHEGLAMYAADERWWEDPRLGLTTWLRSKHLPFPALVEAFPHTADELFAGAAYYQSYQMVSFLGARTGRGDFGWFVDGVTSGAWSAQTCFEQGVGLADEQLEIAWRAFMAR